MYSTGDSSVQYSSVLSFINKSDDVSCFITPACSSMLLNLTLVLSIDSTQELLTKLLTHLFFNRIEHQYLL